MEFVLPVKRLPLQLHYSCVRLLPVSDVSALLMGLQLLPVDRKPFFSGHPEGFHINPNQKFVDIFTHNVYGCNIEEKVINSFSSSGDAVFFHCNLLHRSDQNSSDFRRWAFLVAYNRADNNPMFDHQHARYSPLKRVTTDITPKLISVTICSTFSSMLRSGEIRPYVNPIDYHVLVSNPQSPG